ncbi:flagellar hook-length control protein FliK [Roseobacter sp.]|uniref:flagellar hook-length control protein FliK n=1 Tax=Roseobacter sp. TaxID=1907202 RepID=UPI00385BC291
MLEIPMLQTTAKADRNATSQPKEVKTNAEKDTSDVDFESAYASETEEKPVEPDKPKSDAKPDDPEKVQQPKSEKNNPDSDEVLVAKKGAITESETVEGADLSSNKVKEQEAAQKPKSGMNEWAITQNFVTGSEKERAQPVADTKPEQKSSETLQKAPVQEMAIAAKVSAIDEAKAKDASGGRQELRPVASSQEVVAVPETTTKRAQHAGDTGSPATAQLTALTQAKNPEQLNIPQTVASPAVEKSAERALRKGIDERNFSETEMSSRADPKIKLPAAPSIQSSPTTAAQPLTQLTAHQDGSGLDIPLTVNSDAEGPIPWDSRASASTALAQTIARPETPGMIGRQMAEVLQRMPDRPVELALNPEELGRVRLSISAAEGGITVSVLAERPETLDLMRRHIDQLAREFQALGYNSINFAFNEGQSEHNKGNSDGSQSGPNSNLLAAETSENTVAPIQLAASTGVDLRL